MIEPDVLERTLATPCAAAATSPRCSSRIGASSSARFDDGRVEELVSGRDRGAGLRVVRGDTTGFAHTADLSPSRGSRAAADAAAAAARGGGGGTRVVALEPADRHAARTTVIVLARDRREGAARSSCSSAPTPPPAPQGGAITSVTASYADAHRRILVANSDGLLADDDQVRTRFMVQCVATGDTGMQTGYEAPGRTMGFELFDAIDPEDVGAHAPRPRARACSTRCPRRSGKIPVVLRARRRRRAVPRGVRPRARGRPHLQGRVGVPRPDGRAGRVAARHARRRRHVRHASGERSRSTTRAIPRSATC